jgi:type III pantothenate kinase
VRALLVIDVGNTSTAVAVAHGKKIGRVHRLDSRVTDRGGIRRLLKKICIGRALDGAVLCSVVPELNAAWNREVKAVTGAAPLRITHRLNLGVTIDYPSPASIGADRLANASAAVSRYGAPVIVADFGTALTFDVVSEKGAYIGGVIAPGPVLMTDYLAERTALLPNITIAGSYHDVGRSTVEAMRIGARIGYRGMVREIVNYLTGSMGRFNLCATGGYARLALEGIDMPFEIAPDLTLYGLVNIFELNQ